MKIKCIECGKGRSSEFVAIPEFLTFKDGFVHKECFNKFVREWMISTIKE